MSSRARWLGLVGWLVLCQATGALGAWVTMPEIDNWYRTLVKPPGTPPDSVFGPVWTTLYVLMAIAAWLVWRAAGIRAARVPLTLFAVQLLLNLLWSFVFFGLHAPGWAFAEIVVLWLALVATAVAFFARNVWAGVLLVPYWVWVTYAAWLNFMIWRLNVP
ncbi:MAG: TspO/MBR family protein [Pirellulaceae bacterium]